MTASTLRKTSSAICLLVAGSADVASFSGRHSATSTLCWVGVSGIAVERASRRVASDSGGPGIAEEQLRRAEAQPVALAQPLAPDDALAVDVGAVARQPVVDERPLVADLLEQRVRARHLDVPAERDVGLRLAPDASAASGRAAAGR